MVVSHPLTMFRATSGHSISFTANIFLSINNAVLPGFLYIFLVSRLEGSLSSPQPRLRWADPHFFHPYLHFAAFMSSRRGEMSFTVSNWIYISIARSGRLQQKKVIHKIYIFMCKWSTELSVMRWFMKWQPWKWTPQCLLGIIIEVALGDHTKKCIALEMTFLQLSLCNKSWHEGGKND